MSTIVVSPSAQPWSRAVTGTKLTLTLVLALWLTLVILLGAVGAFVSPAGKPPLPVAIGFGAPIVAFWAAFWLSRSLRAFVTELDLRLISAIQAWRFGGLGFLALYAYNVLPGAFALGAGLGDMAIGLTAPYMVAALIRRPKFAGSRTFMVWNALGVLDLVAAIATGALSSALATGAAGEITTAPMAQLPLVLIPAYLVPIFLVLHVVSLSQARRVARDLRRGPN